MGKKAGENGKQASGHSSFYSKGDDFSPNEKYCGMSGSDGNERAGWDNFMIQGGKKGGRGTAGIVSLSRLEGMDSVHNWDIGS